MGKSGMQIYETMPFFSHYPKWVLDNQMMLKNRISTIPPQIQMMAGSFFHASLFRIFILDPDPQRRWNESGCYKVQTKAAKQNREYV
jgi:hypothetical protein